jgi:hypothetical protein
MKKEAQRSQNLLTLDLELEFPLGVTLGRFATCSALILNYLGGSDAGFPNVKQLILIGSNAGLGDFEILGSDALFLVGSIL